MQLNHSLVDDLQGGWAELPGYYFPALVGICGPDNRIKCAGTLIRNDSVLTAAHCVNLGTRNEFNRRNKSGIEYCEQYVKVILNPTGIDDGRCEEEDSDEVTFGHVD